MPGKKINYSWIILLLGVMTVTGALGFARFGYTTILPAMKTGLALNDAQTGDLAGGNLAGYLLLALTCGMLASKFSPRLIISTFLAVSAMAMFLTGISDSFISAFFARTLTGMGSGGANVPVMGLISAWFACGKRGFATGIAVSGSSFGLLITGIMVPLILDADKSNGWRYSWIALSFVTVIMAVLCFIFIKNNPDEMKKTKSPGDNPLSKNTIKVKENFNWSIIYKNIPVWHLAAIYTLFGFSYIIYSTFYVKYLTNEAGFSMEKAGFYWAAVGAASIISGFIWGSVSDGIGRKYALSLVFFLQAASFVIFGAVRTPAGILLSSLLFALTAWSIPAIMAAAVGDVFGHKIAPAALGFVTFFFGLGQIAGPFISGRMALLTGSYSYSFIMAGIAALSGGLACLAIGKKRTMVNAMEQPPV